MLTDRYSFPLHLSLTDARSPGSDLVDQLQLQDPLKWGTRQIYASSARMLSLPNIDMVVFAASREQPGSLRLQVTTYPSRGYQFSHSYRKCIQAQGNKESRTCSPALKICMQSCFWWRSGVLRVVAQPHKRIRYSHVTSLPFLYSSTPAHSPYSFLKPTATATSITA